MPDTQVTCRSAAAISATRNLWCRFFAAWSTNALRFPFLQLSNQLGGPSDMPQAVTGGGQLELSSNACGARVVLLARVLACNPDR